VHPGLHGHLSLPAGRDLECKRPLSESAGAV